jgi:hypothetical protein
MICRHCGKEYSDKFEYCPYCAEPKPRPPKTTDETYVERKVGTARFWSIFGGVLLQLFCLVFMGPILGLFFGMLVFPVSIWAIIYGTRKRTLEEVKKNSRETIIKKQFFIDKSSICPNCGSHDIKIYRKGYNYSTGFWGATFGVKGAGYAGGFGANNACCRCMNCGNDWETDYDYRLINK